MRTCWIFLRRAVALAAPFALALWLQTLVDQATSLGAEAQSHGGETAALDGGHTPAIDSGFLIVDNRYIAPPYRIEHDGEQLRINGIAIGTPTRAGRFAEPPNSGGGPGFRGRRSFHHMPPAPRSESSSRSMLIQAERLFLHGSLVIKFTDGTVGVFPHGAAILVTLLSDGERTEKLRFLMSDSRQSITLAQWSALVDGFEADDGLRQRLLTTEAARPASTEPLRQPPQYAVYLLTVLGMILTVASFGIVLSHRPQHFCRWSDINRIPRDVRLVIGCAAMIAVLCVFDLVCTLAAAHTMNFWEINPFGAPLVAHPMTLSAVKLTVTFACVAVLWSLRFYRGTQLASWWLCLGLTLLAARWVVFNSLLLA